MATTKKIATNAEIPEVAEELASIVKEKVGFFTKLSQVISLIVNRGFVPLFTDVNGKGETKVSLGRAPLLFVSCTMCFLYAKTGNGPDTGILAFMGMAMAYNGFSKKFQNTNNQG